MTGARPAVPAAGPTMFARFAYPPNERGLCGPDDHAALLGYASSGAVDRGLADLVHGFDGAWPYLELIAGAARRPDPLDREVVEAYWVGNSLTDQACGRQLAREMEERFGSRAGAHTDCVVAAAVAGLRPTHAFHVFGVYPWVGLLRSGRAHPAVVVLDQCRIRWGQVLEVEGDTAVVSGSRLVVDPSGAGIALGEPTVEVAHLARDGYVLGGSIQPGDCVALHWDWVCGSLSADQRLHLEADLRACVAFTNRVPELAESIGS